MKTIYGLIFLLSFLLFTKKSEAQIFKAKNAVEYNEFIISHQNKIGTDLSQLITYISSMDKPGSKSQLETTTATIQLAIKEVRALESYNGNSAFRDAAVKLFEFYHIVVVQKYPTLLKIMFVEGGPGPEDINALSGIMDQISIDEGVLDEKFQTAQKKFASDNEFSLNENEFQKKLNEEITGDE